MRIGFTRARAEYRDPGGTGIDMAEVYFLLKRLEKVADQLNDEKWRVEATDVAAYLVVRRARRIAPRSRYDHYVYLTRDKKIIPGLRARPYTVQEKDDKDVLKVLYKAGNLRLSIQNLIKLKKRKRTLVGPNILTSARSGPYGGSERKANGFYAQFLYGGAIQFRQEVMEPALEEAKESIIKLVNKKVRERLEKAARQNGFNVAV